MTAKFFMRPSARCIHHYMPRKTGVQCLRALKADVKTRSIPVIMYTMSANLEEEKVALLLSADHYMKKTATFEHLCMEVKRLLTMVENQTKSPGELRG
jgi:DNA-binding response OmpR family regulator